MSRCIQFLVILLATHSLPTTAFADFGTTVSVIQPDQVTQSKRKKANQRKKRRRHPVPTWVDECPPCPECEEPVATCEDVPVCYEPEEEDPTLVTRFEEWPSLAATALDPPPVECPPLPACTEPTPPTCPEPPPLECDQAPIIIIEDKPKPCWFPPLSACGTCPDPPPPPVCECVETECSPPVVCIVPPAPQPDYAALTTDILRAGDAIPKSWLSKFDCQQLGTLVVRAVSRFDQSATALLMQERSARACVK